LRLGFGFNQSAIHNPQSVIERPSFARAIAKAKALKEGYGGQRFFDILATKN